MGLRIDLLAKALSDYLSRSARGSQGDLSRKSGVAPSTIKRIAVGEVLPTVETWEKLYRAAPDIVPQVTFDKDTPMGTHNAPKREGQSIPLGEDDVENDLIRRMLKVLRSRTTYASALRENIIAFSEAVDDFNALGRVRPTEAPGEIKR